MSKVAIVIPAFKRKFLADTLNSLANQTCHDFTVYIGDDHSQEQLYTVVESYQKTLDIVYVYFTENFGRRDLVTQWERCIALTREEQYLWLFSDDDLLPVDAVERFLNFEKEQTFDICRLPLELIDAKGIPFSTLEPYEEWENAESFLYNRMQGKVLSSASNYIFTRKCYNKYGFIHFPLAWCSDDASWINMGKEHGIYTIMGLPVQMRMSNDNISSKQDDLPVKYLAEVAFMSWALQHFAIADVHIYNYLQGRSRKIKLKYRMCVFQLHMRCMLKILLILNNSFLYKVVKHIGLIKREVMKN